MGITALGPYHTFDIYLHLILYMPRGVKQLKSNIEVLEQKKTFALYAIISPRTYLKLTMTALTNIHGIQNEISICSQDSKTSDGLTYKRYLQICFQNCSRSHLSCRLRGPERQVPDVRSKMHASRGNLQIGTNNRVHYDSQ